MLKRTIKHLDENIRNSIINDVRDIAYYHGRLKKKASGFFSIPRHVFCYADYLGYIAFGHKHQNGIPESTRCAVDFIKKYFPVNYHGFAEIIYSMWRLGTVHSYEPYSYFAGYPTSKPRKITIKWLSNNESKKSSRKNHLKFFSMKNKRASIYLYVNNCQLVDDLLTALDNLLKTLAKDAKLKRECEKRLNEYGAPRDYTSIASKILKNAIPNQIVLAWKNRQKTKINEKGEII